MRVAVLADIHGNLPALDAVLEDVRQQGADAVVVLGDLADRGPYPTQVLERVQQAARAVILGNTDAMLLRLARGDAPAAWFEHAQFAPLRWTYERLGSAELAFLRALPEHYSLAPDGVPPVRFVHGSPRSASEPVYPDREPRAADALRLVDEAVLGTAHIHIPWQTRSGGKLAFNPGSVGQPFNGDRRAQYAMLVARDGGWQVEHRAIDYDHRLLCEAFGQSGLLARGGAFARAALTSMMTGRDEIRPFLEHAARLAGDEEGWHDGLLPDRVWQRASETYDWRAAERGSGCTQS